ncbi:hypothetical protein CSAL01_12759 [Colletotrichum salicis]|uniref:Helicase ATP-binding domain-containing protein n=1 Tax=Colletotrichum salicis TaxID=1209931 RepID=A0A135VAB5_9PEZI|nr:hypothetical protein CSAL01_12759 [Colletotrichum salicis]
MGQLSDALHELVRETWELLAELTATEDPVSSDGPESDVRSGLPAIPWSSIEDDHSETKPGYSFLAVDRNGWVSAGDGWLFRRLARSPAAAERWGLNSTSNARGSTDRPFQLSAVQEFGRTFERLRERLWMLLHMLGGQPARASELAGLRTVNTVDGGVRNILVHNKMLCFVTAYHKGYRTTGQAKEVQGIMPEASGYSAFLWADDIIRQRESEDSRTAAGLEAQSDNNMDSRDGNNHSTNTDEAGDESAYVGAWTWKDERTWTTGRARRIMQRTSMRLLGCQVNVSMWRYIAIGIANRYLNESFGRPDRDDDGLGSGKGTDKLEDSPGLAARQQQFRRGSAGGRKKTEAYEGPRLEARLRRFEKLRRIDLKGQLRQMAGDDSAGFRGNQREAVLAIASGLTPIVQVMGTGGGKSVSFMLPAFCSPDGVTVVVTPLVALRTDLHRRCVQAGITSHVWQSRKTNQAASIIFVTPESAVTKGLRDFIVRLEGRQALDRVVVDECHVVLEGSRSFRPRLRELGEAIRDFSVQTVCLTATLAPTDEAAFFYAMRLETSRVRMFQTATTRKNIRYSVVTATERTSEEDDDMVPQEVWDSLPPDPEIQELERRRAKLKGGHYRMQSREEETEARKLTHKMRTKVVQREQHIVKEYREYYLYDRPTWDIERQARGEEDEEYAEPEIDLRIPERARLTEILCCQPNDLSSEELLQRRIEAIDLMVTLCDKRDTVKRDHLPLRSQAKSPVVEDLPKSTPFRLLLDPNQCPDCIGDEKLPLEERMFKYCRTTVRNDHFDDQHLREREHVVQRAHTRGFAQDTPARNMALESLADQLQDLNLTEADCLPFQPTQEMKRTLETLDDTPRYLFRIFSPKSCGITDKTWTKSMDARYAAADCKTDIFLRVDKHKVAGMIYSHLNWLESPSDNLVSWTTSLLFALVYVFHLRANARNASTFANIFLCIVDTTCFPQRVFLRDMDLIRAYKPFNLGLKDFEVLRSRNQGQFYFGEYLSQGALRIEDKCEVVSAQAIIDQNLYGLLPELENFAQWKAQLRPPWAKPVVKLREKFFTEIAERQGISRDGLRMAINISNLFGQRWRMPMAINLIALSPHRSDDTDILLSLRNFTARERGVAKGKSGARGKKIDWQPKFSQLTVVDLSCPYVTAKLACSLFKMSLFLFLEQRSSIGRVVALDKVHKHMKGYLDTHVHILTQEPTVSVKLLELCSITIVHRLTSPDWLHTLKPQLAGISSMSITADDEEDEVHAVNPVTIGDKDLVMDVFFMILTLHMGLALVFAPCVVLDQQEKVKDGPTVFQRLAHRAL